MIKAVLFDLDGVLVSTDECHYLAWKKMADEEGIPFDRAVNERLRGVSRMRSLEIILEKARGSYTAEEKAAMAERKNAYYRDMISCRSTELLLPGATETLEWMREHSMPAAIASSSKNTRLILSRVGWENAFQAVIDGNCISHSKPDPEAFLKAAEALGQRPENCLVVEDAEAGVEAGIAGGMKVLGVGGAAKHPLVSGGAKNLSFVDWNQLLESI